MPIARWTDERLDDLARRVTQLDDVLPRLGVIEARVSDIASTVHQIAREERKREEQAEERRERDALERKADRRWMVGTSLLSSSIVITAIGLLADKL